ncbi:MAG: phenylalanine--tRNA ligase subunit alpha [Candidatus Omnitrophica bacterium]|nr:phenylalanine--tRNA ligase subunit alpha [Candidatus Omnitrophota bacterium]
MQNIDFENIRNQAESEAENIATPQGLEEFRLKFLGRKGLLAQVSAVIPTLPKEQRAEFGQKMNVLKNALTALVEKKEKTLVVKNSGLRINRVDLGLPGIAQELGRLHPITQVIDEISAMFARMGFIVVEGPEIETEYNNFTGLNIPLEHPSRDTFDTFYIKPRTENREPKSGSATKYLLRSHTSPVQVRAIKERKPPLSIIVPGRVYRPDAVDASHSFMFHQVEGFMVDKGIKFSDLKGILEVFAKGIFGENIKMRFRPHFFPFTEPSAEVDISCIICGGKGCSVCGRKGWLEVLGCGMIHPNVFKHVGIDPKKYTGFAFGMGVERIAMLKYGINDIRLFFENDLRFLKQF